jgi:hypothetical protein
VANCPHWLDPHFRDRHFDEIVGAQANEVFIREFIRRVYIDLNDYERGRKHFPLRKLAYNAALECLLE